MNTLEKAFRMVDIGPDSDNKVEVHSSDHVHCAIHFVFKFLFFACITVLTHGLKQALEFRKFWGEKAELRRFKDGRIAESTGEASAVALHLVDPV